jgi:hypothetical protein
MRSVHFGLSWEFEFVFTQTPTPTSASTMKIELIPTLHIQRELYEMPRDMARFNWYIEQMTRMNAAGEREVVMPINAVNPMGKPHCLVAVNALIALDAEEIAKQAALEAEERLSFVDATARLCINLLDDVGGGWTNRYFSEASFRMGAERSEHAKQVRNFAVVPCWSSEVYTPERIRQETLVTLYRYAWFAVKDVPKTLKEIMHMNGFAGKFASSPSPVRTGEGWGEGEMAYTHEVIQPHPASTDFALNFACLFGDAAARECGYEPMGLSAHAGFALALAEAMSSDMSPEDALITKKDSRL